MTKTSFADIKVQPGWHEELKKAKKEIRRLAKRFNLTGWKIGGAFTGRVRARWNQFYNGSFSAQHRYKIYSGIDDNDLAIWLETKLIQWSQDKYFGVKQGRIAVLNSSTYSEERTGCVYMVAFNKDMYGHTAYNFCNIMVLELEGTAVLQNSTKSTSVQQS